MGVVRQVSSAVAAVTLVVAGPPQAGGQVHCQKRQGEVVKRTACKGTETMLGFVRLGAAGPRGPARPRGPAGPRKPRDPAFSQPQYGWLYYRYRAGATPGTLPPSP